MRRDDAAARAARRGPAAGRATSRSPNASRWSASCCCATMATPYRVRRPTGRSTPTWASTSARSPPTWWSSTTDGGVVKEIYVKTDARPVEVVEQGARTTSAHEIGDSHQHPRRRHHRLGPRADRRADRRRHRQRRDHRPQDRRRLHRPQDRPAGRHDLRDRRPGLQVHQPAGRRRRRLRHERGLRRRHRLLPRRAGREARHHHQGRVRRAGALARTPDHASASAAPSSWSATSRPTSSAARRKRGPGRRPGLLDRPQLPQPGRARAHDRRLHLLPGRHRLQRRGRRRLQPASSARRSSSRRTTA